MKHLVLFSLKYNEKIFMNVVCCSRDWRFKGYDHMAMMSIDHCDAVNENHIHCIDMCSRQNLMDVKTFKPHTSSVIFLYQTYIVVPH